MQNVQYYKICLIFIYKNGFVWYTFLSATCSISRYLLIVIRTGSKQMCSDLSIRISSLKAIIFTNSIVWLLLNLIASSRLLFDISWHLTIFLQYSLILLALTHSHSWWLTDWLYLPTNFTRYLASKRLLSFFQTLTKQNLFFQANLT